MAAPVYRWRNLLYHVSSGVQANMIVTKVLQRAKCSLSFFLALTLSLFFLSDYPQAQEVAETSRVIVLKNATIHSQTNAGTFVGSVVITDGKITEVFDQSAAAEPTWPADAKIFELTGFHLTPGLIDATGSLWMEAGTIGESSTTAALDAATAIDPYQEDWREVTRQGVTTVGIHPAGGLGGYSAAVSTVPSRDRNAILLKNEVGVSASLGINAPTSLARHQDYSRLKTALKRIADGAAAEKEKEDEGAKEQTDEQKDGEETPPAQAAPGDQAAPATAGNRIVPPNRTDELLKRVIKGEVPLHLRVRHSDAIAWAISLADEFKIRIVLEELPQAARSAERIRDLNLPIVVGPFAKLSKSTTDLGADFSQDWIADIAADGGVWAVSTFSNQPRGSRLLRMNAASLLANVPVTREQALAAITLIPAKILGIADQVGSIEVGKRADISVFAGDPLNPSVPVRLVVCNGQVVHEATDTIEIVASSTSSAEVAIGKGLDRFAIRSKRVWLDDQFQPATLLIENGNLTAIGNAAEPVGIPLFDVGDSVITPALVAVSQLGHQGQLAGSPESDATLFRAIDSFDSRQRLVKPMWEGGFLHIGLAPLTDATSSGCVGHLRLGPSAKIIQPHAASQFVLSNEARNTERFPASLIGQVELIDEVLTNRLERSRIYVTAMVARELKREQADLVARLANGDAKAIFAVGNDVELTQALALARQHQLRGAVLTESLPPDQQAELLESGLGLIVRSARGTEVDRHLDDLAQLIRAGVPVAFAGDDPQEIRTTAALLGAAGVPQSHLLNGLTKNGAVLVGLTGGAGGLNAGAPADFIIWDGSPLDLSSRPLAIFIDGKQSQ
ncbi:MAG: amidohydrolase family protein [Pirellulaceae bacterium]|nr:amidohydrolase family protein [Pirellulaceae bacterium]